MTRTHINMNCTQHTLAYVYYARILSEGTGGSQCPINLMFIVLFNCRHLRDFRCAPKMCYGRFGFFSGPIMLMPVADFWPPPNQSTLVAQNFIRLSLTPLPHRSAAAEPKNLSARNNRSNFPISHTHTHTRHTDMRIFIYAVCTVCRARIPAT